MANNQTRLIVDSILKDASATRVIIGLDPTKWSSRKRNIVTSALTVGVADCGRETAWLINALGKANDINIPLCTKAYGGKSYYMYGLNDEKDSELTSACVALYKVSDKGGNHWMHKRITEGDYSWVTLPIADKKERAAFFSRCAMSEDKSEKLLALRAKILRGEQVFMQLNVDELEGEPG